MRTIDVSVVTQGVKELFIKANYHLPEDVYRRLCHARDGECEEPAATMLGIICDNAEAAKNGVPICQDTGMAVVFAEVGQDVHLIGGFFREAVNEGVRLAYQEGCLRKSVVSDPLLRVNSEDNTPAVLYTELVPGDKIRLFALPKGFGSENMSRIRMFNPTASREEIISFITETVKIAGGNPCPPLVIGIGIGGTFDYSAVLAKKALLRTVGEHHPVHGDLEEAILSAVNQSGVGVQGLGKGVTALWASVETYATHIAGLPVAVNISCHATRHADITI
ncbi:MAG: fumarate hydratase [Clostridia bacterium]|nr:fumarate hydratase [Clostridia bacterium]